jgi:hypothetical protein
MLTTDYIIRWLKQKTKQAEVNNEASGRKLFAMARQVAESKAQTTQELRKAFDSAIAKRRTINQYWVDIEMPQYGCRSQRTLDHEWYTSKRAEAKDILFINRPQNSLAGWGLMHDKFLADRQNASRSHEPVTK